jgi:hypothetical protein
MPETNPNSFDTMILSLLGKIKGRRAEPLSRLIRSPKLPNKFFPTARDFGGEWLWYGKPGQLAETDMRPIYDPSMKNPNRSQFDFRRKPDVFSPRIGTLHQARQLEQDAFRGVWMKAEGSDLERKLRPLAERAIDNPPPPPVDQAFIGPLQPGQPYATGPLQPYSPVYGPPIPPIFFGAQ